MAGVLLEKKEAVAWLTLNRPEKRNALSLDLMQQVIAALEEVQADPKIHVLVIRGNGPMFSAGHDINEMAAHTEDLPFLRNLFGTCNHMMEKLHELPQPVIAQVHGIATAAGCQLVAACDLAICEENARFATPGAKIGLFCTTPMVPLVRVIGRRRALDMLLSGRFISAQEAERYGLVNRVVPLEALAREAELWAEELAQYSRFTLSLGKAAFYEQVDLAEHSAYQHAKEIIAMNCLADDAREGMKAFLEKRPPRWKHC